MYDGCAELLLREMTDFDEAIESRMSAVCRRREERVHVSTWNDIPIRQVRQDAAPTSRASSSETDWFGERPPAGQ